jgi:hypothetical protein
LSNTRLSPAFVAGLCSALLPLAALPSPNPHPHPRWSGQGSTLSDQFPYHKPIPYAWLTHQPDDGGSKHRWNDSKLLPNYMA